MLQNLDFIVAYGLRNGENPVFQDLKRRTAYYGRSLKPQKTWFCGYETVTAEKVEIVRRLPNPEQDYPAQALHRPYWTATREKIE